MYALVEIAGQQFKVEQGKEIFVYKLKGKEGDKVSFEEVLLIANGKEVLVGTPKVAGARITASIQSHLKGDKVIVFKKKRRKGYKVKNGHRQHFTKIKIEDIVAKGMKAVKTVEVKTKESAQIVSPVEKEKKPESVQAVKPQKSTVTEPSKTKAKKEPTKKTSTTKTTKKSK